MNVSKHKSFYLNSVLVKINFIELIHSKSIRRTKHTLFNNTLFLQKTTLYIIFYRQCN